MTSMTKSQPLPEISRFNWKDGFYSPQQIEEYKAANERAKEQAANSGFQGRRRAAPNSSKRQAPKKGTKYSRR